MSKPKFTPVNNPEDDLYKQIDILAFTGTQEGMTKAQRKVFRKLLAEIDPSVFIHGDCIGADAEAHAIAFEEQGREVRKRPCNIPQKRAFTKGGTVVAPPEPPLDRNHKMVDDGQALVATPKTMHEELRSGTWATVRYARKLDRPVWIIWPDGTISTPVA
jgi:hypothetical protein